MNLPRRAFLHLAAGAAALPAVSRVARAQAYPTRPVRIIVTFAAGAANDVHGRLHGQWLSERLGQPFIVENRPGGAGTLGAAEAIRSRPDGYTLFLLSISHAINASLYEKLPYNIVHDTTPIASFFQANYVMVVNPSLPVTSVAEFIAYVKANPGKVNLDRKASARSAIWPENSASRWLVLTWSTSHIVAPHSPWRMLSAVRCRCSSQPRPIRFHRSGVAKSVLWQCPPRPAFRLCLMYRRWLSTCPITHLIAGSASPGLRISLLKSSRYSTGRSMRLSLGQKSRRSMTIWDYASAPRHLQTSANSLPTKPRSGAESSGPPISSCSEPVIQLRRCARSARARFTDARSPEEKRSPRSTAVTCRAWPSISAAAARGCPRGGSGFRDRRDARSPDRDHGRRRP